MSKRVNQINELFRRAIGNFILTEIEMPDNAIATVTKVASSNDLKNLRICISVFPPDRRGSCLEILKNNIHQLKEYLADELSLRVIPKIRYDIDASENAVEEIDNILREIENEKK